MQHIAESAPTCTFSKPKISVLLSVTSSDLDMASKTAIDAGFPLGLMKRMSSVATLALTSIS